jgi:hypothetical protein
MKAKLAIVSTLALLGATACGPRYMPVAAHTLSTGENQEKDVVWITEDGNRVLRCQDTQQGPVCSPATVR